MKTLLIRFLYPAIVAILAAGIAFVINFCCVVDPDRKALQEENQKQEIRNDITGLDAWLTEAGDLIAIRRADGENTDILETKLKSAWSTRNKADEALRDKNLSEAKILIGVAYDSLRPDEVRVY